MYEVDAEVGRRIMELEAQGMTPDEAYRQVMKAKVPTVKATVEVGEKPKRPHKYGAIPTEVDGIRFDSKKEARRYVELKYEESTGEIEDLILQPVFVLHAATPDGPKAIGKYVADFGYRYEGKPVYEDVKGHRTPMYRWKKKHTEMEYGIEIKEI